MFCVFHKERLAQDKCSLCSAPLCSECQRVMHGKVFCKHCFPAGLQSEEKYSEHSPVMAALLGIFPGLGQVYNGQLLKGFVVFFTCWLIIPWIYGVYDAYVTARRINEREIDTNPSPAILTGCLVLIVLVFGFFSGGPFFLVRGVFGTVQDIIGLAPQRQVERVFTEIAEGLEAYRSDNGEYPGSERDLFFSDITYSAEMFCDTSRRDYHFVCDFSPEKYVVAALPLKKNLPRYRMRPGVKIEEF